MSDPRPPQTPRSPRLNIGLDFDDTLMHTREALVNLLNSLHGTSIRVEDCDDYYLSQPWALTEEQFHAMFEEHQERIHTQPPLAGLLETLTLWKPQASFHVITGRPDVWLPSVSAWLARHGVAVENVIASRWIGGKGVVAQQLKLDFFVEDHTPFAIEIADSGIPVFLLDRPYNQKLSHPQITRVKDWHEIRELAAKHFNVPEAEVSVGN